MADAYSKSWKYKLIKKDRDKEMMKIKWERGSVCNFHVICIYAFRIIANESGM